MNDIYFPTRVVNITISSWSVSSHSLLFYTSSPGRIYVRIDWPFSTGCIVLSAFEAMRSFVLSRSFPFRMSSVTFEADRVLGIRVFHPWYHVPVPETGTGDLDPEKIVRTTSSTDRAVEEEEKMEVQGWGINVLSGWLISGHIRTSKLETRHRLHAVMQEDDRRECNGGGWQRTCAEK